MFGRSLHFARLLGEVKAQKFCFEIHWPLDHTFLDCTARKGVPEKLIGQQQKWQPFWSKEKIRNKAHNQTIRFQTILIGSQ
jgi:hypothetical protein